MIHANLVDGGVFFGVAALTLLLMMFLYAVVTADPEEGTRTEAPLMPSPVLPPAPLPVRGTSDPLPVRGAQAFAPPVFPAETGRPGGTDHAATHRAAASVARRWRSPAARSGGPRPRSCS